MIILKINWRDTRVWPQIDPNRCSRRIPSLAVTLKRLYITLRDSLAKKHNNMLILYRSVLLYHWKAKTTATVIDMCFESTTSYLNYLFQTQHSTFLSCVRVSELTTHVLVLIMALSVVLRVYNPFRFVTMRKHLFHLVLSIHDA